VLAFLLVDSLRDVATAAIGGDGALVRSQTQELGAVGVLALRAAGRPGSSRRASYR